MYVCMYGMYVCMVCVYVCMIMDGRYVYMVYNTPLLSPPLGQYVGQQLPAHLQQPGGYHAPNAFSAKMPTPMTPLTTTQQQFQQVQHTHQPSTGKLPDGWEQKVHTDGRVFYVDHHHKSTHWALPEGYTQQPSTPSHPAQPTPQQPLYISTPSPVLSRGVEHTSTLAPQPVQRRRSSGGFAQ